MPTQAGQGVAFHASITSAGSHRERTGLWWVWNRFVSAHVALYRASGGRIGGTYRGAPVLLLHHVGRKSGRERVSPLIYLRDGADL